MTLLEGLAGCPWRTFVSRVLRIQPTPDPLASLPGIDARLVGTLVHAVLEMIVREAAPDLPRTLPEVRARLAAGLPPALVAWPEPAALERLLAREAERVSREAGIVLPGMARALAERVRPFLEVARREDWARAAAGRRGRGRRGRSRWPAPPAPRRWRSRPTAWTSSPVRTATRSCA